MRLKDIGTIITGNTPSKKNNEYYESNDILFVKPSDIEEDYITSIYKAEEYISEKARNKARILPKGSVLVTCIGTIGKVGVLKKEATCNQQINAIIPNEKVNSKYLAYLIQSKQKILQLKANAPVVPIINKTDFSEIEIKICDVKQQQEVVRQLDFIKEIIDTRKQQLGELQKLIKSQFVEMFGDEKKYPKEELKNNVVEMFIGPFGSALKNEYFVSEKSKSCVVYEQKHAINKYIGEFRYVDSQKHNELKRFEIIPNDIIVSCRGTIGETFVIPDNAPLGIMHPSIMKIRLKKEKYNSIFFNEVIKQYLYNNLNQTKGGTVKMGIRASELEKTKFIRPELEEQINFLKIKEQIDKQKLKIEKSLEEMQELYESLMEKYFG